MSQDIVRHNNIYQAFSIVADGLNGVPGRLAYNKKKKIEIFFTVLKCLSNKKVANICLPFPVEGVLWILVVFDSIF